MLKALILLLPVASLIFLLALKLPKFNQAVAILLGVLWNIPYLILGNILAIKMGWWTYAQSSHHFYTIPIELLIGWAVLWGALLPYALQKLHWIFPIAFALLIDLYLMPELKTLFSLGENWLIGETVLICTCLIPSLIIHRIYSPKRVVGLRALAQSFIWGGWIVFLIPAAILHYEGKEIFDILHLTGWKQTTFINAMAFSMFIGYAALHEFAKAGKGTPIPFDPPEYLVTTGPYAYLANPLQTSTLLMQLCLVIAMQSLWLLTMPLALVIYSEVFVKWHHKIDIEKRFGQDWKTYKQHVRDWIPRWKPYVKDVSKIYFEEDCNICMDTKQTLAKLQPQAIEFHAAHNHQEELDRARYVHADQLFEEKGVSAIARIYERLNLPFAMLGWLIRLPVMSYMVQIIMDGVSKTGRETHS